MHGGGVVLGEVVAVEAGLVQRLELEQPLAVELIQGDAGHVLDVVEDAELDPVGRVRAGAVGSRHRRCSAA